MEFDINSLKDFIPFGSAMLGAVTGGLITYTMSKSTQRKEKRLKGLESINELKLLIYDINLSLYKMKREIEKEYKENGISGSEGKLFEHLKKIPDFYNRMLIGEWAVVYTKAVHINTSVYSATHDTYNKINFLYNKKGLDISNGAFEKGPEWFVQKYLEVLKNSEKLLDNLTGFLEEKEQELIQEYMNKYIKEKKFYLF
ncbi:hypothetical protein [Bacillus wiedmannii]|uniref:hypothetical protein n=1 Tax=Bacillus wiedmannii TaxID=1890302 RepID=UPI003CEDC5CC